MNTLEAEARARHLTAILEEAVGEGVPPRLAAAITVRVTAMRRHSIGISWLAVGGAAAGIAVVLAVALLQRTGEGSAAPASVVGTTPAESMPQEPLQDRQRSVVEPMRILLHRPKSDDGRSSLQWKIGERRGETLQALAGDLRLVAGSRPSRERGQVVPPAPTDPLPLVIEPADEVLWSDVVAVTDAAMAASFLDIRWHGIDAARIVPKSVAATRGAGPQLAAATFHEPDDEPHALRPTFELFRDGRIVEKGEILFAPIRGVRADYEPLQQRLLELRRDLEQRGEIVSTKGERGPRLRVPVLLRVEHDATWRSILPLLVLVDSFGFNRIEIAVVAAVQGEGEPSRVR